jgi:hypothetical protein
MKDANLLFCNKTKYLRPSFLIQIIYFAHQPRCFLEREMIFGNVGCHKNQKSFLFYLSTLFEHFFCLNQQIGLTLSKSSDVNTTNKLRHR